MVFSNLGSPSKEQNFALCKVRTCGCSLLLNTMIWLKQPRCIKFRKFNFSTWVKRTAIHSENNWFLTRTEQQYCWNLFQPSLTGQLLWIRWHFNSILFLVISKFINVDDYSHWMLGCYHEHYEGYLQKVCWVTWRTLKIPCTKMITSVLTWLFQHRFLHRQNS